MTLTAPAENQSPPATQGKPRDWPLLATYALSGLAVAALLVLFYLHRFRYAAWTRMADLLYLVSLWRDIVGGESIRYWKLTPAPGFFPDWPLFFLCQAVGHDLVAAFIYYAGACVVMTLACFYWLSAEIFSSRAQRWTALGLLSLLMIALNANSADLYSKTMLWLLVPTAHGGATLVELALLPLFIAFFTRGCTGRRAALIAVLVAAGVMSDMWVIPQLILPILAASAILLILGSISWKTALAFALSIAGGLVLAVVFTKAIVGIWHFEIPNHPMFVADRFVDSCMRLGKDLADSLPIALRTYALVMASCAAGILFLFVRLRLRLRMTAGDMRQPLSPESIFVLITLLVIGATVVAPLAMGFWSNMDAFRYFQPAFILPVFLLALLATQLLARMPRATPVILILGFVSALAVCHAAPPDPPFDRAEALDRPLEKRVSAIIARHKLHNGYSEYWNCKRLRVGMAPDRTFCAVRQDLAMENWIGNPHWAVHDPSQRDAVFPLYDFIVVAGLDRQLVIDNFGEPAAIEGEPDYPIFIYNRPQDIRFRNIYRTAALKAAHRPIVNLIARQKLTSIVIPQESPVTVPLPAPTRIDYMDLFAPHIDQFECIFLSQGKVVSRFAIDPSPGNNWRSVVPPTSPDKVDAIQFRSTGPIPATIFKLFAYEDVPRS